MARAQDVPALKMVERGHIRARWASGIVPGESSQPAVADLNGDGHLAIVLPGSLDGTPVVMAWKADGTPVPRFPVAINHTGCTRIGRLGLPSVASLEGNGHEQILVSAEAASPPKPNDDRGHENELRFVFICDATGQEWPIPIDAPIDPSTGVTPLADVDGSGVLSIVAGQTITTVLGEEPKGWLTENKPHGYSPCIGDADGDGHPETYQPEYEKYWHLWPEQPEAHVLDGLDSHGKMLRGWPQKIEDIVFNPVMGDVDGDGKAEVCVANGTRIHLWTWNGKPLPATHPEGQFTSVFKSNPSLKNAAGEDELRTARYYTSVSLADLDGDDRAEILAMSSEDKLYAWHGDGRGVRSPDGFFADCVPSFLGDTKSPRYRSYWLEAVVANLEANGDADVFVGNLWFTLHRDGSLDRTQMAPGIGSGTSIVDLDGDGKAEAVFLDGQGQIVLYDTGLPFPKAGAQWPTARGNFHRTGAWVAPSKRIPRP